MNNLVVLEDNVWEFPTEISPVLLLESAAFIISTAVNVINGEILLLTNTGILISQTISTDEGTQLNHEPWNLNLITNDSADSSWFAVKIISETGAIVCLSHSGHIVSVASNRLSDEWADEPEAEGCVEAGIASAAWNPDESVLVLVTHNDTLLCMTSSFELVSESPTTPRSPGSPCLVSWRGDGAQFSMYCVDSADNTAKVRLFNKDLELLFEGRNVGEGAVAVVKGLLPAIAYAPNGSLVAVAQQRTPKKQQIVFLERSGLRHGEFDLQEPSGVDTDGAACSVVHLEWNIESTLLAVVLEHGSGGGHGAEQCVPHRTVQLYHRNNYHWYLKQQWSGLGLRCLGFDVEVPDRLYLSEKREARGEASGVCLRVVNMIWDTCVSLSADCSCVVVDGRLLKVTPLGKAVIPPPMSKYQLALPAACQHVSFGSAACGTEWILAALCDDYRIRLFFHASVLTGSEGGPGALSNAPPHSEDIDLRALGGEAMENFQLRGVHSVVCKDEEAGSFLVVACVASAAGHALARDDSGRDNLIVLWRPLRNAGAEAEAGAGVWMLDSYPIQGGGKVQRLVPWSTDACSVGVGIMTPGGVSSFDITKVDFFFNPSQQHVDVKFSTEFVFSENCSRQLAVIKLDQTLSCSEAKSVKEGGVAGDSEEGKAKYIFVGLSAAPHTSRLYVNDHLLSSAHVSSFAANPALGVLMFVTASAKPLLQFTSIESLYNIANGSIEANLLLYESNVNDAQTNYNATTSFAKRNANTEAAPQANVPQQQQQQQGSSVVTFALPRPVERGTRLVGTPNGSALVVLQMPRGNLEGCEPRPLVLMKSRLLLADCKYFDCLLLLRRQRVDMNLLVDHDPAKFVANATSFVTATLERNPEYLSLLITALEVGNVCFEKYPIPSLYTLSPILGSLPASEVVETASSVFQWEDKVNVICRHLRTALFEHIDSRVLVEGRGCDCSDALLPLLCTYAKQQPPLLSEALYLVKRFALGLTVAPSLLPADVAVADALSDAQVANALSYPKSQKCLKYIAFLCDYNDLFRAALAECDFDMARAIARQGGQMDPKEYLPLLVNLQSFRADEGLGATATATARTTSKHALDAQDSSLTCMHATLAGYCLMRFNVYVHLELFQEALTWALQCLRVISSPSSTSQLDLADEQSLFSGILSIVMTHNLHASCIPSLRTLRADITSAAATAPSSGAKRPVLSLSDIAARKASKGKGLQMVSGLLSKVLCSFGEYCHTQGKYEEAITAFLSSSEPSAPRSAIHAAIVNGSWLEAIAIGGRFYVEGDDEKSEEYEDELDPYGSNKVTSLNPRRIAQGIIEDYKSMLEQGLGGIESSEHISLFCSNTQKAPGPGEDSPSESGETQAVGIATLCLEYFNDIEGAVAILLLAKAWRAAAQMASRHRRTDLLTEEVGGALKFEALAMIRRLPERTAKQTELVLKLNELWSDPAARLEAVSGVDAGLLAALRGEEEAAEETRSEFGGGMSVYSNLSLASNLSAQSGASNVSHTLSMLSDSLMSQASAMSSQSGAGAGYYSNRKPSGSSFSVVGLEHNLLSRGSGDSASDAAENDGDFHPHETNKQKRLRMKKDQRGRKQVRERDVFGLKLEASMSKELYELGDVSGVATSVSAVCSVLLLIGGSENQQLACQLQACMDAYTSTIAAQTAPSAPLYPLEWLRRRDMEEVRWFQASPENANPLLTHVAEGVWWRRAVRGLALWNKIRRKALSSSVV